MLVVNVTAATIPSVRVGHEMPDDVIAARAPRQTRAQRPERYRYIPTGE